MIDTTPGPVMRPIFYTVGFACLLISVAWVLQAWLFKVDDGGAASAIWTILGAAIAGVGAAFLLAGRYWTRPDL